MSDASAISVARKPVNPREIAAAASFGCNVRKRTFSLMLRLPHEQGGMITTLRVDGDIGVCIGAPPKLPCDRSGNRRVMTSVGAILFFEASRSK